jgi:hypothetical protein
MFDAVAWLKEKEVVHEGKSFLFPHGRELGLKTVEAIQRRMKRLVAPKACPHCDCKIDFENPRSTPQLRRYFAMLRAFLQNWPSKHPEQFDSEYDFRKWIQMKAGPEYREVSSRYPINNMSHGLAVMLVKAGVEAVDGYAYPVVYNGEIVVFKPKSIAYEKMQHRDFCRLCDDVAAAFESETGLIAKQVFKETEDAA